MGLVKVPGDSLALTAQGRQKPARLEMARSAVLRPVLRRLAGGMEALPSGHARLLRSLFGKVIDRSEALVRPHLGPSPGRRRAGGGSRDRLDRLRRRT